LQQVPNTAQHHRLRTQPASDFPPATRAGRRAARIAALLPRLPLPRGHQPTPASDPHGKGPTHTTGGGMLATRFNAPYWKLEIQFGLSIKKQKIAENENSASLL